MPTADISFGSALGTRTSISQSIPRPQSPTKKNTERSYVSLTQAILAFVGEEIAKEGAEPFHDILILSEIQLRKRGIKIKQRGIFYYLYTEHMKSSVSGCLNIAN